MSYLTEDEFQKHLQEAKNTPYLAVDTEGTINHPFSQTWGLSFNNEYFAFNHRLGENLPQSWLFQIKAMLENHPCLVFHHAKHDLRALRNLGIDYRGKFYCTMLMAHMINENFFSKELEYLSKYFGGDPKRNSDLMDRLIQGFGWEYIPVPVIRPYGANDSYITIELFYKLLPEFKAQGFDGVLWDIEQEFCRLLADMEDTGILIDQSFCEHELERGTRIMSEIRSGLGFNPGSPVQLGHFLIDELKLPIVKKSKKTKKPSFDKEAMKVYDELLELRNDNRTKQILTYRGWAKTTGSNYRPYLEKLSHDGRFRTNFKQHGTVTGRLSASILQQIPRASDKDWNGRLKKAFLAKEGYTLWDFDYSQLEFRLKAAYAKQQNLLDVFNDPSRDIFNEMSEELGMSRNDTKTLNYTISYGGGEDRISHVFGVSTEAARAIKNNYYTKYRGLKNFTDRAKAVAQQKGYIQYWTGRRRHFQFESEHRLADNSAIQGGAFEIVKRRTLAVKRAGLITDECKLNLQVHDDVVFEIENGKENEYVPAIKEVLENVEEEADFGVKFKVDAKKWGE